SAERVTRSVDESLQRMGLDYLDIVQCHDIEFGDLDQVVEEALPALRKLQKQGKVRFVGVTGFPLKIFKRILDRTELDCMLSYCHYSLNNTSLLGQFDKHGEHFEMDRRTTRPRTTGRSAKDFRAREKRALAGGPSRKQREPGSGPLARTCRSVAGTATKVVPREL